MDINFGAAIGFTKPMEGGYTNRRTDSGNWSSGTIGVGLLIGSNMGVGAPALIAWVDHTTKVTANYMRALPDSVYTAIARARYWRTMGCQLLPAGVDVQVFDHGWNRGVGTSVRLLQSLVGLRGDDVDGDCGPATAAKIAAYGSAIALISALGQAQDADYRTLHNFDEYGKGWITRCAAREVQAHQVAAGVASGQASAAA